MNTQIKSLSHLLIGLSVGLLFITACRKDDGTSDPGPTAGITTLDRTIVPNIISVYPPRIYPCEIEKFLIYGYGGWQYGPGIGYQKRLDLMPAGYSGTSVTKAATLLRFFTMSDIHVCDEETPAQCVFLGYHGGNVGAYSPSMLLTTQSLEAVVRTINVLHKQNKFDFGISLGDDCDNTQYNELRWFIDILDGLPINPDSGTKDDPIAGPGNDYQDPFQAEGLDKSIPWYQALGNHDHFWKGSYTVTDAYRPNFTGTEIIKLNNPLNGLNGTEYYAGSIDGRTRYGDIIGAGAVTAFPAPPRVIAADPGRRSLKRGEWIGEFFNTTSNPRGHGFSQDNKITGFACYSFEPKADLPLKVIVLDDTEQDTNPDTLVYAQSSLDQARFDWLIQELKSGQSADKLMIIAAHIPVGVGGNLWNTAAPITEQQLLDTLHHYPNLILWMSGHRHINAVTVQPSPNPARPELGFWEVETSSIKDFPQEFRTYDIARNSDNSVSIFATNVDAIETPGSLSALARTYAIASYQINNGQMPYFPSGAYNAELVKPLSSTMKAKLGNTGTAIRK